MFAWSGILPLTTTGTPGLAAEGVARRSVAAACAAGKPGAVNVKAAMAAPAKTTRAAVPRKCTARSWTGRWGRCDVGHTFARRVRGEIATEKSGRAKRGGRGRSAQLSPRGPDRLWKRPSGLPGGPARCRPDADLIGGRRPAGQRDW